MIGVGGLLLVASHFFYNLKFHVYGWGLGKNK
jgi:hypothetical protein